MHELSIALSIVEIAEAKVKEVNGSRVRKIVLEIGELAGVEWESLDFVWGEVVKNTVLEASIRIIDTKEGLAECMNCEQEFNIQQLYQSCPRCNDFRKHVLEGKEIYIKSLEIA